MESYRTQKFWWMYFFNFMLSFMLCIMKSYGYINISYFVALLPVSIFTLALGIVMVIFAKAIVEDKSNGKN